MPAVDLHTAYHIGVSAALVSAYILTVDGPQLPDYLFIGGFVMGVGFMKECYDESVSGRFDPYDILANGVGVGLGIGISVGVK